MNYLYHRVPYNLTGKYLMPLNELKKKLPVVYKEHAKKYLKRDALLSMKVPKLNCLWNDALHLIAVHPKKINKALKEAGVNPKKRKWFKINPKLLDSKKTIVYLYKKRPLNADSSEFIQFNVKKLPKYSFIGKETKKFYKKAILNYQKVFTFHLMPHILYKGKLRISDLEVIET